MCVCTPGLGYIYKCLICKFVSACVSVCNVNMRVCVCGQCVICYCQVHTLGSEQLHVLNVNAEIHLITLSIALSISQYHIHIYMFL